MKVLVAHNFYKSIYPSGENEAVLDDVNTLREAGVDVVEHFAYSDTIESLGLVEKAVTLPGPLINIHGLRAFRTAIADHRPDLVHVHNLQPLISPMVILAAHRNQIPVVHTIHNYRQSCIAGTLLRDGKTCEDCVRLKNPLPGVAHACYRGSTVQSAMTALSQVAHRRTWRSVDRYIVLTRFMADFLERVGLPRDRFVMRPTTVGDPGQPKPLGTNILFVGRLDEGKGVDLLVEAWRMLPVLSGRRLRVVGSGPLSALMGELASTRADVDFLGQMDRTGVAAEYGNAAAVVVPSRFPEGFPRVVAEAFAHGRAVVVPKGGNLASISPLSSSYHFEQQPAPLADALQLVSQRDVCQQKGGSARAHYLSQLTPAIGRDLLLGCYTAAIAQSAKSERTDRR